MNLPAPQELLLAHASLSTFKLGDGQVCPYPIPLDIQSRSASLKPDQVLLWRDAQSKALGVTMVAGSIAIEFARISEIQINYWTPVRGKGQIELAAKTDRHDYPYFAQLLNSFEYAETTVRWLESHQQDLERVLGKPIVFEYCGGDY
jgi:hypothetical protein